MTLRRIRETYNLSQLEAAEIVGVPVRTLRRYESDESYGSPHKREMFANLLNAKCEISEEKGLLSVEQIQERLTALFDEQYRDSVKFCFLFGSYAKGYATEKSDVDLCISSSLTGLRIVGLTEAIRGVLHKKVDLVRFESLKDNFEVLAEIMKSGIAVYR